MGYEVGQKVMMAKQWSSYIETMRRNFRENPIVEIIGKLNGDCYDIRDFTWHRWSVKETEIVCRVDEKTLFL